MYNTNHVWRLKATYSIKAESKIAEFSDLFTSLIDVKIIVWTPNHYPVKLYASLCFHLLNPGVKVEFRKVLYSTDHDSF